MCSPVEGPRRTETSHFFNKIVGIKVSRTYFLTICVIIFQHTGRIFIRYYAFYIYIYICTYFSVCISLECFCNAVVVNILLLA